MTLPAAEQAVASAISSLTSLKELVITLTPTGTYQRRASTGRLCTSLHPLTMLTRLEALVNPGTARHLPPSLRELDLLEKPIALYDQYLGVAGELLVKATESPDQSDIADLSHLTVLTHLTLRNDTTSKAHISAVEASLPARLEQLQVFGYASISGLQTLGCAELHATRPCDLDILHQLAPLQHPWALEVCVAILPERTRQKPYRNTYDSDDDRSSEEDADDPPSEADLAALQEAHEVAASGLGFSSHLSSLLIEDNDGYHSMTWSKIPWCEAVAGLQHLQEICIAGAVPEPKTLMHLKALPALRSLTFRDDCPPEAVAVGLLPQLIGLEELCMHCGRLRSVGVLGSLSALTSLSRLELYGWQHGAAMSDDELPMLMPLQRLRVLHLEPLLYCSLAARGNFLRYSLPLLQEVQPSYVLS